MFKPKTVQILFYKQSKNIYVLIYKALRIRLVGGVKKWEDKKFVRGWKSGRIEKMGR